MSQAPGHSLRGDLGAGACAGLPRALFAADGLRGRERAVRHLGPSADDGARGASARHVPRGFRIRTTAPRRRISAMARRPRRRRSPLPAGPAAWAAEAENELKKIPFFVRGKARRNTERFAQERGLAPSPSRRSMMPRRISPADAPEMRVVLVTMDSHLARAAERAAASLRSELPGLRFVVHAAEDWSGENAALMRCQGTSRRATSSSPPCCSSTSTSARSCRPSRRGATAATRCSAASRGEVVRS
jgi:hypothetical protein